MNSTLIQSKFRIWRWRIFTSTWVSYAGFYLTRKAFAASKISLSDESGLGFSDAQLGLIDFSFLTAYMIGQFLNGPLADRLGPRRVVLAGLIVSIIACASMGLASAIPVFVTLAIIHGVAQATGWPSLVKNMSAWFSAQERGRVMGWWCTNYAIGGLIATPFAALMIDSFGNWRFGFFMPSLALVGVALIFFFAQKDRPEDVGLPSVESFHGEPEAVLDPTEMPEDEPEGAWRTIAEVFTKNPTVVILGIAYFCLKPARYAILFWGPKYIHDELGTGITESALITAAFELGGPLGVLSAGYISDKLFGARRFPVCVIMLTGVGVTLLALANMGDLTRASAAGILFMMGFFLYGPDSILSGTAAMDFGTKKAAGTATGFVNGMGSVGAIAGGGLPGWVAGKWGWIGVFTLLAGFAFVAALILIPLWNRRPATAPEPEPEPS